MTRAAALGAALLAAGCLTPIQTETFQVDPPVRVRTIAVQPIEVDALIGTSVPSEAPGFARKQLLDALRERTELRVVDDPAADARLGGQIRRWSQRVDPRHPASVWLVLELVDRDGRVIWRGTYEETQAMLSDDLLSFGRAWQRGFQWVTAEELADYGLRELVADLARDAGQWS